jgi:hypothetical protein
LRVLGVVMADMPFFRFFTNDWLSHTRCLGAEARGVLIDVVCLAASCERRGFLHTGDRAWTPTDIAKRLTGDPAVNQRALAEILAEGVLSQVGGCYCYAPMVEDAHYTATKAEAGAKGGKEKHRRSKGLANDQQSSSKVLADGLANDVANTCPQKSEVRSQSSEVRDQSADSDSKQNHPAANAGGLLPGIDLTPTRKRKATNQPAKPIDLTIDDVSVNFARFYVAYPRKKKKMAAWEVWQRDGLEKVADKILWAVAKLKASDDWTKDDGKWVPYPASFLNSREYLDLPGYIPPSQLTPSHESTYAN